MSAGCERDGPRILLIEPQRRLRVARAQRLISLGCRVSALANVDSAPQTFPPHLYDVIVVTANESFLPLQWCERLSRTAEKPVVVVLSRNLFSVQSGAVPAVVISGETQKAREEKLVAFLHSQIQGDEDGPDA